MASNQKQAEHRFMSHLSLLKGHFHLYKLFDPNNGTYQRPMLLLCFSTPYVLFSTPCDLFNFMYCLSLKAHKPCRIINLPRATRVRYKYRECAWEALSGGLYFNKSASVILTASFRASAFITRNAYRMDGDIWNQTCDTNGKKWHAALQHLALGNLCFTELCTTFMSWPWPSRSRCEHWQPDTKPAARLPVGGNQFRQLQNCDEVLSLSSFRTSIGQIHLVGEPAHHKNMKVHRK